jgi:hypothetical protein
VLYSSKNDSKKMPVFSVLRKFHAQSYALNPKLGDWEDIHNLGRIKTGKKFKEL